VCCSLEHSQVNTVDLLKSHFGTALRESFTLLPGGVTEDCSLFSGWFPFTGLRNMLARKRKFPARSGAEEMTLKTRTGGPFVAATFWFS
jgi:hypothetical protein